MMKMYKLRLSIALVEQREPAEEVPQEETSIDPVKRDGDFNAKVLSLMEKGMSGRITPRFQDVPANTANITQTFDMPAQSFEDALRKKIADSCADVATPSSEGLLQNGAYLVG
jgi:hypothetical protein